MPTYLQADLDHIALDCKRDPLNMVEFYACNFGFEPCNVEEYKAGKMPFPSVRASPLTIIDFFAPSGDSPKLPLGLCQNHHFCFSVTKKDWYGLKSGFEEKKVEVKCPNEKRFGARGPDGVSLYVKDPDGNLIEFRHYDSDVKISKAKRED